MKIKVKSLVTFTAEEKKALSIIGSIDCTGVYCVNCPFNLDDHDHHYCLKSRLRYILRDAEVVEVLDND